MKGGRTRGRNQRGLDSKENLTTPSQEVGKNEKCLNGIFSLSHPSSSIVKCIAQLVVAARVAATNRMVRAVARVGDSRELQRTVDERLSICHVCLFMRVLP